MRLLLIAAIAMMSSAAFATDSSDGCGLGWQITQDKTLIATTTRGTTNAFVPPTFGMTSGTIGCDQHDFAANEMEGATYAATNFEMLKHEMAQGQGETLAAFAQTLGCDAQVSPVFGHMTQAHFSQIIVDRKSVV